MIVKPFQRPLIPLADSHSMVGCCESHLLFEKHNIYYRLDVDQFIAGQDVILEELN